MIEIKSSSTICVLLHFWIVIVLGPCFFVGLVLLNFNFLQMLILSTVIVLKLFAFLGLTLVSFRLVLVIFSFAQTSLGNYR